MSIRAPFGRTLAVAGSLLTLGGCAATTPPPRFTAVSPADPAAAESALPAPAAMLTGGGELAEKSASPAASGPPAPAVTSPDATSPTGHEHHGTAEAATVFTCPLHPEVAAKVPGKCRSCGLTLVKKAAVPKEHP